jgi:hypothetical protein
MGDFSSQMYFALDRYPLAQFLILGLKTIRPEILAQPNAVARFACRIDQDPSHHLGRNPEKVRPALPIHRTPLDQLEIGLVDHRCWLQRVVTALASHVAARKPAQLVV